MYEKELSLALLLTLCLPAPPTFAQGECVIYPIAPFSGVGHWSGGMSFSEA